MKIEIIEIRQDNSFFVTVELIINDTILMTKEICKMEIFDFLDYSIDFGEGDSLHYLKFSDEHVVYTEFYESEIQDYLNNNLEI